MDDESMHHNHNHSSMDGSTMEMKMSYSHMTFFWGKNSEILFSGWPGSSGGMYALALVLVFAVAVLVEWFNARPLIRPEWGPGVAGVARTAMHALRTGMAYLIMLAVMSFNGGVLLVAVAGHAVGHLLFSRPADHGAKTDLPLPLC